MSGVKIVNKLINTICYYVVNQWGNCSNLMHLSIKVKIVNNATIVIAWLMGERLKRSVVHFGVS